MTTITSIIEMQTVADGFRRDGKQIGFVPTMGALHEGHMSLVDEAKKNSDIVVMSVFVNPTQFGRGEDFEKYPRDLQKDQKMAEARGVGYVFAPSEREMYPEEPLTFVEVQKVSQLIEGEFRPRTFSSRHNRCCKIVQHSQAACRRLWPERRSAGFHDKGNG